MSDNRGQSHDNHGNNSGNGRFASADDKPGGKHHSDDDGGANADHLVGTQGADSIDGGGGDDVINGLGGADTLNGNGGDDDINGGEGIDTIDGGDGADVLNAGAGGDDDTIFLGTEANSPDGSGIGRDSEQDIVVAQATFAANGTDSVFFYSDTQGGAIAQDTLDFSAFIDFDGSGATAEADELLEFLYVEDSLSAGDDFTLVKDRGGDGSGGDAGNDNTWFILNEFGSAGNDFGDPEIVQVLVDGQTFEWDFGTSTWDEII